MRSILQASLHLENGANQARVREADSRGPQSVRTADELLFLTPGTLMIGNVSGGKKGGSSRRTLYGPIISPAAATKWKIILNKRTMSNMNCCSHVSFVL